MDSNKKSKAYMQSVRDAAAAELPQGFELLRGPIHVEVVFCFARPKSHFRTGKRANELKDGAAMIFLAARTGMEALRPLVPDTLAGDVAAVESLIEWADKSCVFAGHPFDGGSSGVPVEVCDELIDMLNDSSYTASSIREKSFVKRFISAVESVNRGESVVKQSLTTENGLQSEEINSIERALKSLLQNIAPQIEPFDDVAHLISQIDNWCAGTRNELREEKLLRQTAGAEEAALESQLREARDDNTKLRESEASAAMMRDVLAECVEQLQPAESVDVVIKPGKWPHSLMAAKTVLQSSDAGRSLLAELDAATLCVREIANFIDPNDETEDTPVELGCRLIEEHKSLRAELDAAKAEVERLTKELKASEDAFRVTDEQLRGANEELLSRAARIDDLERQLAEREQSPAPAVGVPVEVEPIWQAINSAMLLGNECGTSIWLIKLDGDKRERFICNPATLRTVESARRGENPLSTGARFKLANAVGIEETKVGEYSDMKLVELELQQLTHYRDMAERRGAVLREAIDFMNTAAAVAGSYVGGLPDAQREAGKISERAAAALADVPAAEKGDKSDD